MSCVVEWMDEGVFCESRVSVPCVCRLCEWKCVEGIQSVVKVNKCGGLRTVMVRFCGILVLSRVLV